MNRKRIAGPLVVVLAAVVVMPGQQQDQAAAPPHQHDGADGDAVQAMSHREMPDNPHMKMTALRPSNEADRVRGQEIVGELRAALKKYKDYRVAEQDGYQAFLPQLDLPEYHFTNYKYGFIGALWFRAAKPTSLLYRKKSKDGYELIGAMYTASRYATESELNRRVPLSVARWHAHINICLPAAKAEYAAADWKQFGFTGSIATEEACAAAGGEFHPQIFGWMLHVYPFEKSPEKIWAH
jgi:hypothetical protein